MITLICGRPRAGKTTYSKRFENVIHLDDSRFLSLKDRYNDVLNKIRNNVFDIVVDGIYSTKKQRIELLKTYKGFGSRCIWINTDLNTISKRYLFHKKDPYPFDSPTYDEGWDEVIEIGE